MFRQLTSGFLVSSVKEALRPRNPEFWDEVWQSLCSFTLDADLPDHAQPNTDCAVLSNILCRGLPTLPSVEVEESISSKLDFAIRQPPQKTGCIQFKRKNRDAAFLDLLAKSFAIVDPRLTRHDRHAQSLEGVDGLPGSSAELAFTDSFLPDHCGEFVSQILERQRALAAILKAEQRFHQQRADFTFLAPTLEGQKTRGLIIEIDGPEHDKPAQRKLDGERDAACRTVGVETLRIRANELDAIPEAKLRVLKDFLRHPWLRWMDDNYLKPLFAQDGGMDAMQLALSPYAVARLQRVLVEAIRHGVLRIDQPEWKIAVIERDVPFAELGVADFLRLLSSIVDLRTGGFKVPRVKLRVYTTPEFAGAKLAAKNSETYGDQVKPFDADLLIDLSMLQRRGFTHPSPGLLKAVRAKYLMVVRSAYHPDARRAVECAQPVKYSLSSETQRNALLYFLRNLFRKDAFREGQPEILWRALALENVIALLPTGAGKSLAYQLATLLQPGAALVIDPLRSLMHDQDENLKASGIDSSTYINSTLNSAERIRREEAVKAGQFQFIFISPERLQIEEFRKVLGSMGATSFSYCVVDEAHCVSEWGHDFRTAYLRLGENAAKFCPHNGENLPIIALTGTASFDVLADVQRELRFANDVAMIAPSKYKREELHFELREVRLDGDKKLPAVASEKCAALLDALEEIPSKLGTTGRFEDFMLGDDEYPNSGIVFCPHAEWKLGVREVLREITAAKTKIAKCADSYASRGRGSDELERIQSRFKSNETRLLVATKAFGMGIDKPNIRFTVHFNMPQSIEAFYQEAGRAGRDRDPAYCYILYCREVDKDVMMTFHRESFRGVERECRVITELLEGIADSPQRTGIEASLATMAAGQRRPLVLGFANHALKEIAAILSALDPRWTIDLAEKATMYCYTPEAYLTNLGRKFWGANQQNASIPKPVAVRIGELFSRYRDESDTFKAVYRMSLIGCVDDYEVDYNSETIKLMVVKRSDDEYRARLAEYVARYLSREDAKALLAGLDSSTNESTLRKCLWALLEFVYNKIAAKRRQALDVMEAAIQVGLAGGDFDDYVHTYFDSRFTPELRKFQLEYDIGLVWTYIGKTGGDPDAVNHLRGACDRLLIENPENGALLLLRAFSRLLIPHYNKADAGADLRRGFEIMRAKFRWDRPEYVRNVTRFIVECTRFDSGLVETLGAGLIKLHADWLHEQNERMRGRD